MIYSIHSTDLDGRIIYITSDNKVTCIDKNSAFQSWLRENQGNLPSDIQDKIDAGELTIQDAD